MDVSRAGCVPRRVLAAFCWCAKQPSCRPTLADEDAQEAKEKERGTKRKSSVLASGRRWAGRAVGAGLVPATAVANPGAKRAKLIMCAAPGPLAVHLALPFAPRRRLGTRRGMLLAPPSPLARPPGSPKSVSGAVGQLTEVGTAASAMLGAARELATAMAGQREDEEMVEEGAAP